VAIARYGPCGIDVEEVAPRSQSTVEAALGPAELALFAGLPGDPERWFARFWTAKEAVAKLRGTGLRGEPRDFEVVAAAPGELTVRAAGHDYRVCCADVENLPGAPPRRYVVAWTEETKETAG
jgi:phosphopantetheine--protein transferase-like protein